MPCELQDPYSRTNNASAKAKDWVLREINDATHDDLSSNKRESIDEDRDEIRSLGRLAYLRVIYVIVGDVLTCAITVRFRTSDLPMKHDSQWRQGDSNP